jgi:hypothetical protein
MQRWLSKSQHFGLGTKRELARRPDDRRSMISRHANSDHVLCDELSELDAWVARRDKIEEDVIGGEVEHDIRVVARELAERRRQHRSVAKTGNLLEARREGSWSARCAINRSPASVAATLRVVRASRRTPCAPPNPRIA